MDEKKLLQLLRSMLRRASLRWPPAQQVRYGARVEQMLNVLTGRVGWHCECAKCHTLVPEKFIRVDHIVPIGTLTTANKGEAVARMFPLSSNAFQALCKGCHDQKTYLERYGKPKGAGNSKAKMGRRRSKRSRKSLRKASRAAKSRRAVRISNKQRQAA